MTSRRSRLSFTLSSPPASRPPAIAWHWRAGCEALRAGGKGKKQQKNPQNPVNPV